MRADHGCPGERQNGTLRFTVGFSTLNPIGWIGSKKIKKFFYL